ncbi:MAG TPA: nicotinate-nucleotide adenylyltransferase [Chlamydiales bacterium]|nr:nicotinate-nucleotide adenylyltransferase [Chlamydiales bacterium]
MIGFFGGTFDPIHFGHIALAIDLLELHKLKKVLFCPALYSPFKTQSPPIASPAHRLAMLKLALDHPQFEITTLELDRAGPSYTIDTIRALKLPNLRLILSEEAAAHLDRWKETQELIRLAPPLIGPRDNAISSTAIRERLKKNLYCKHLIPAPVLKYIQDHKLYQ